MADFLNNWQTFQFFGLVGLPAIIAVLVIVSSLISLVLGFISTALKLAFVFVLLAILSYLGLFDMLTDFLNGTTSPSIK